MAQVINEMDVPSHSFVFHGTGERYFLICVVNVLLTIITLGIYLPWALMKCKRYLYANMEVNGQRFSYGITGGNVFVSCLVFVFFYFAILMTEAFHKKRESISQKARKKKTKHHQHHRIKNRTH